MFVVDVNILLYALDGTSPSHRKCLGWLEEAGDGDEPVGISSTVMASVIRIATNPAIANRPAKAASVIEFLEDVRNMPRFLGVEPGVGHWPVFAKLVLQHNLARSSLTDGWIAALALEAGAKLVTTDTGFDRFRGLSVVNPVAPPTQ